MILGVIATIIVGYWGIKYASRYKTRVCILYFENSCISLFKSVVKELDELEIKFKNETVNENLITYKGTFFNSGNTDIDKNLIHNPLKVILPKNYEWKKVKIIDNSKDVDIQIENNLNELIFSWEILKENEYFTFDSVIEYKPEPNSDENPTSSDSSITRELSRKIAFEQRITHLKSIEKERIPSKPKSLISQIIYTLWIFGFALLGLYFSAGQFVLPDYKTTYEVEIDSSLSYVTFENKGANQIQLIDSLGNDFIVADIKRVNNNMLTGNVKIEKENLNYGELIGGGIAAVIMLLLTIFLSIEYINDKRLYEQIKEIAEKYDFSEF